MAMKSLDKIALIMYVVFALLAHNLFNSNIALTLFLEAYYLCYYALFGLLICALPVCVKKKTACS